MPLDPSIITGASGGGGAPQGGGMLPMLDSIGKIVGIQNALNQTRLFGQEFAARSAIGPLLQQSVNTDPSSADYGGLDVNKFMALAAQNPAAAWKATETVKGMLENRAKQIENATKELEQNKERMTLVNNGFSRLLTYGENVTNEQVMKVAGEMVSLGIMDPKKLAVTLSTLPESGPAKFKWLQERAIQSAGAAKALELQAGEMLHYDLGNKIALMRWDKLRNQLFPAGFMDKKMSPNEAAEPIEVMNPDGSTSKIPKGQFAEQQGTAVPGTYTGEGATGSGEPGPQGTPATAVLPPGGAPATLSPELKKLQEEGTSTTLKYMSELNSQMFNWLPLQSVITAQRKALADIEAGKAAEAKTSIREAVQFARQMGVPLPESWKKWAEEGNELPAAQTFRAAAATEAITMMKQAVEGTGRAMRPEVDIFVDRYGKLTNDPRTLEAIYNFVTSTGEKYYNQQQGFIEFRKELEAGKLPGYHLSDYPAWAARKSVERGDIDFSRSTGNAKGTTPSSTRKPLNEIFK